MREFIQLGLPILINLASFWFIDHWVRWINFGVACIIIAIVGLATVDNVMSGCWGAPKEVEFRQGMTLCPGQSAAAAISLEGLKPPGDGI